MAESKQKTSRDLVSNIRKEMDSLGEVNVPADKLWGAQTQRSLEHFSIGKDLMPREMITAYATLKKAAATANHDGKRLDDQRYRLIVQMPARRHSAWKPRAGPSERPRQHGAVLPGGDERTDVRS